MAWLHYFSLRRLSGKVFWSFFGLALLVLLAGLTTNFLLNRVSGNNIEQLHRSQQYDQTQVLQSYIEQQAGIMELSHYYSSFDSQNYYKLSQNRIQEEIRQMQFNFPASDKLTPLFNQVLQDYQALNQLYGRTLDPSLSIAENFQAFDASKEAQKKLETSIQQLLESGQEELNRVAENSGSFIWWSRWVYLGMAGVMFFIAVLMAWMVTRIFSKPLADLAGRLRRIAGGDLTEQIPVKGSEEIAELASSFNQTVINLKQAISRIQTQAGTIAGTSQQLEQSSTSQASSLSEQAVAVAQVSVTVEELSNTSQRIADSAVQVADSASNALEAAQNGYDIMLGVSQTMAEIRERVNMIADRILALNSIAQRIRDVTSLIDNISNETHLLALNAAIESASAGEEGARFGVVAGHVRKLAQRSRVAAIEIQQLVSQIQKATTASVMATEEGIKVSNLGEKMVSESLNANEQIIEQVTQTSELAQSISLATDQQRIASNQLAETLRGMSQIINQISTHSQEYRISAVELNNVVTQLNSLANRFVLHHDLNGLYPANFSERSPALAISGVK
jgi:methyl-accepting chemotaxis protein